MTMQKSNFEGSENQLVISNDNNNTIVFRHQDLIQSILEITRNFNGRNYEKLADSLNKCCSQLRDFPREDETGFLQNALDEHFVNSLCCGSRYTTTACANSMRTQLRHVENDQPGFESFLNVLYKIITEFKNDTNIDEPVYVQACCILLLLAMNSPARCLLIASQTGIIQTLLDIFDEECDNPDIVMCTTAVISHVMSDSIEVPMSLVDIVLDSILSISWSPSMVGYMCNILNRYQTMIRKEEQYRQYAIESLQDAIKTLQQEQQEESQIGSDPNINNLLAYCHQVMHVLQSTTKEPFYIIPFSLHF